MICRVAVLVFALWALPAALLFALVPVQVDFSADRIGTLPGGWDSNDMEKARHVYSIDAEEGRKFLHADARNVSVHIGLEVEWDLGEFPLLQWQWRANRFPDGSNELVKDRSDSVLGLYIVFGRWPFLRSIKYIWSDTLPVGASFDSPFSSRTKLVVLRSGRSLEGTWVTEERDVLTDYRRLFKNDEPNPVAYPDGFRQHGVACKGRLRRSAGDGKAAVPRRPPECAPAAHLRSLIGAALVLPLVRTKGGFIGRRGANPIDSSAEPQVRWVSLRSTHPADHAPFSSSFLSFPRSLILLVA
jgi:hypothetical protein